MITIRMIVCGVLALPAAWLAGLLVDRVPPMGRDLDNNLRDPKALPLLRRPLPGLRMHGRYLWMTMAVLAMYVATAYRLREQPPLTTAPYLIWWVALVALSACDVRDRRLPDRIVLPAFVLGTVVMVIAAVAGGRSVNIRYAMIGAGLYFGFFLVLNLISPRLVAFGDVKAAAIAGMAVGFVAFGPGEAVLLSVWGVFSAFVISAVSSFFIIAKRGFTRALQSQVGFGTYLSAGAFLIVIAAPALVGGG